MIECYWCRTVFDGSTYEAWEQGWHDEDGEWSCPKCEVDFEEFNNEYMEDEDYAFLRR